MNHQLGIIGYGFMGKFHETMGRSVPGLTVRGAYDIRPDRVQAAIEQGLIGYDSLEAMLQDEAIDIVVIATPNAYHKDLAIQALRHGKNVVLEKPATITLEEFREVEQVAEEEGRILTVHQNRRWDQDFQKVKTALQEGLIGQPYAIESRICGQNGKFLEWRDQKEMGGGLLLDWAPHLVDQVMEITGEPIVSVYAKLYSVVSENVDDYFKLILTTASGLHALIEVGTLMLIKHPRWVCHGTRGSLVVNDMGGQGQVIQDKANLVLSPDNYVRSDRGPTRTMAPRPPKTLEVLPLPDVTGQTNWTEYYTNVMAAIEGKEPLLVLPSRVDRIMQVIQAARESSATNQSITTEI